MAGLALPNLRRQSSRASAHTLPTPPTSPLSSPPSSNTRSKRPLSPSASQSPRITHLPPNAPSRAMTYTPPPTPKYSQIPATPPPQANQYTTPYQPQFKHLPLDLAPLTNLPHRHHLFSEVFAGKASTPRKIEYLVELKFVASTLRGWVDIVLGRTHYHLPAQDIEFIIKSIVAAYREIPAAVRELGGIVEGAVAETVKRYCGEVARELVAVAEWEEGRRVCAWGMGR
ncbi:hypothetical protein EX30DRAFT_341135 [Ascodesmis nigricans]|uniref:Uncharacterized protein n=1 Tax=Ascodesmis nigricans TaxID=341454 RepID=A0A4S2MW80_9PEZI|nr:hypothetical protein EX30DRAFT_341135 [Ascodesmis nigricans]